ncbi:MAG: aldehyde dehydrogenase (NADP(+)) [Chitinophagaceae bacterium]
MKFKDASAEDIDKAVQKAWQAFHIYRNYPLKQRADFMRAIAKEMESAADALVQIAMQESHLPEARLRSERARTIYQLNSYAAACEAGNWLDVRIDTAVPEKTPPKPDIRKMLIPLGPVVVFGASNFPFAYSTAGGDTASAFAAGCPVLVKAHPAHAETSELVANCIATAAEKCNMPEGIFTHIHGSDFKAGEALVAHPLVKAVGFTGSFIGGKALFDLANKRKEPIPVFAEMSSINPVFLLPGKLNESPETLARMYASSITMGVGQFCTNPGLIIGIDGEQLQQFIQVLGDEIRQASPGAMLHEGIAKNYFDKKKKALSQPDVETIAVAEKPATDDQGIPTIASASAKAFLNNPVLHQEVFGPYSIIIRCSDMNEMISVAKNIEGQLTSTLMATEKDIVDNAALVETVKNICGRFILNGVPTGVEVCISMQHGGPFPATTDSRFTSVGADAIKRFARPMAYQNWPDNLLPDELKNANPLGIWRMVNDELMRKSI